MKFLIFIFIAGVLLGIGVALIFCRDIIKDLKAKVEIAEAEKKAAERKRGSHLTLSYHDIAQQCIKNRGVNGCIDYVAGKLKNVFAQQLEKGFPPDTKFQVIFKKIEPQTRDRD